MESIVYAKFLLLLFFFLRGGGGGGGGGEGANRLHLMVDSKYSKSFFLLIHFKSWTSSPLGEIVKSFLMGLIRHLLNNI